MPKIEDVILFQIDQTSRAAKQHSQKRMDKLGFGLTVDQWVLLKIISEHQGLSQKELATQSHRDPASITRTLDLLAKKGYITRVSIEGNRRTYEIHLTEPGKHFVQDKMPIITEFRNESIKGLSKDELTTLSDLLKRIKENMS